MYFVNNMVLIKMDIVNIVFLLLSLYLSEQLCEPDIDLMYK
jgi:hypothetical protein